MLSTKTMDTDTGQLNLDWCSTLIGGLADAGVQEFVLSPGARSTPLMLVVLRHPGLHHEVILDERSAAWFALGRVRATGRPVALVCTSGTAAANWLPAVVEANQSALPLILISADRPPELHGWGANQTIAQADIFSGQLRAAHTPGPPFAGFPADWLHQLAARSVADSYWPLPGPVHLNLAFREPLLPDTPSFTIPERLSIDCRPPSVVPDIHAVRRMVQHMDKGRGIIVCGEGCAGNSQPAEFALAITALSARLGCPILAEPLSGLRFGPHDQSRLCCHHDLWLRDEVRQAETRPDWVLRFGAFPVTRPLQRFITDAATLIVEPHGRWPDPTWRTQQLLRSDPLQACHALLAEALPKHPTSWMAAFSANETEAREQLLQVSQAPEAVFFSSLCQQLPAGTQVFCGNSMPIRDLSAFSGSGEHPLHFFANRGASGIDGNLATAAGIASESSRDVVPTVAIIGDLTAQHDLGSLALLRNRALVVVIINNGGGGIFDLLPPALLPHDEFTAGWLTPQQIDFSHAAASFGIGYQRCETPEAAVSTTTEALATGQPRLIELVVKRAASLALRRKQVKQTG